MDDSLGIFGRVWVLWMSLSISECVRVCLVGWSGWVWVSSWSHFGRHSTVEGLTINMHSLRWCVLVDFRCSLRRCDCYPAGRVAVAQGAHEFRRRLFRRTR